MVNTDNILTPVFYTVGIACLVAQLVLHVLFKSVLPSGPWRALPSFTAHQAVCLPLMVWLAYEGVQSWAFPGPELVAISSNPLDRVLAKNPAGMLLGQVVLGELLFWDIPTGLLTPALREPLMMAHHFGMAFVAAATLGAFSGGRPCCGHYAVFFFGFIELSGVPLTIVDVFHPKHTSWHDFGRRAAWARALNEVARIVFAAVYLSVRAVYFPYVVLNGAIPDIHAVTGTPAVMRDGAPTGALYFMAVFGVLFSMLQIYWGVLVARQAAKALGLEPAGKAKKLKV